MEHISHCYALSHKIAERTFTIYGQFTAIPNFNLTTAFPSLDVILTTVHVKDSEPNSPLTASSSIDGKFIPGRIENQQFVSYSGPFFNDLVAIIQSSYQEAVELRYNRKEQGLEGFSELLQSSCQQS